MPDLDGAGLRIGIVMSRFNPEIGEGLLASCNAALEKQGVASYDVTVVTVPGALEAPLVLQKMAQSGEYDALIALGAVIRGATAHFDYVAGQCASGVQQAQLETGVPIAFGVLTTDTIEQAIERAGTKAGNQGFEAAMAAIEMVDLYRRIGQAR